MSERKDARMEQIETLITEHPWLLRELESKALDLVEAHEVEGLIKKLKRQGYTIVKSGEPGALKPEHLDGYREGVDAGVAQGVAKGRRQVWSDIKDALPLAGVLTLVTLLGTYGRGVAAGITTVRQLGVISKLKFLLGEEP